MILSPSILAADFSKLGECVRKTEEAGAKWLHIDVMDGVFVPNYGISPCVYESIRPHSNLFFDVHLMIVHPEKYIENFVKAGADGITVHIETVEDMPACIKLIKSYGVKVGISLNPETEPEKILPYINDIDLILVMSVHPGYGGQKYIEEVGKKIEFLREKVGPDFNIEVDGGVNLSNIKKVVGHGANVIVAGSAVFNSDIEESTKALIKEATL